MSVVSTMKYIGAAFWYFFQNLMGRGAGFIISLAIACVLFFTIAMISGGIVGAAIGAGVRAYGVILSL